jgi:putative ABC transport system substrate-binding protein
MTMRRREFISLLGGCLCSLMPPRSALAQHGARLTSRVAYLALLPGRDSAVVKQRLDELGYVEGKNLVFDFRSAEGQAERLPALAAELVQTKPDVIVTGFGTLAAQAARDATKSVPIVFVSVGDPIGAGIVDSLNRPGANITGVTPQGTEMGGKRLQLLEECTPGVQMVAVLMNPETPFSLLALRELRSAAELRGIRLKVLEIRAAEQLSGSIEAAAHAGAGALVTLEDPLLLGLRSPIATLATALSLPSMHGNREFAEAGGLLSYGPDRHQLYRRAAELVDKILKGAKPADIPVEQPTKFELVINLNTARALRLKVPDRVLALADEVIE